MPEASPVRLVAQEILGKLPTQPTTARFSQKIVGRVRVAMIVGDNRTRHCGVKDGAHQLAEALTHNGFDVSVLAPKDWSPKSVWKFFRQLRREKYDILHVQYPSIGYRGSLVPHMLGLMHTARAAVATLHEYSAFPRIQKLSTHVFRLSADALFFGSEYERSKFNSYLGLLGASQVVFPVVSQVPSVPTSNGRDTTVLYFGQIRPNKGLEAYLSLARQSVQLRRMYQFRIMGSISKAHEVYAQSLQAQAPKEIRWSFDLPFEEIGSILSRSFAAYLPFPDGASERRGSLLAAWANGLPVVSQIGPATTPSLRELLVIARDAEEALCALDKLAARPDESERIGRASREYSLSRTWGDVAKRYADVYRALLHT
jgi:glycosyltransferase involved in cell wall biosynthesis